MKNFKLIFSLLFLLSTVSFAGSFTYEASENDVGVYVENDNSLELKKIAHVDLVNLDLDLYSDEYEFKVLKIQKVNSYCVAIFSKEKVSNCQNLYISKTRTNNIFAKKNLIQNSIYTYKETLGFSAGGLSRNCI